ncbi:hypothetical protein RAAC3_TM7C00001G0605 [Candidatus Saccharibacteria bacterium RAAC3_TM7_1]|nr:hypothetical protein RAAC3_TM7C00001G0605 [Candidatus Saccharibacteria bacterium RAAC3_TM7_1]HCZ28400.1 hypothetical protein [Candidatus Saccharibacteria bacterium]
MTYRHEIHESYNHFLVQHTEETNTPSGLILSRHIGLTDIGFSKTVRVGELFVAADGMPDMDESGFLSDPTSSFGTDTLEEAVPPIARRVAELGTVASIAILLYGPHGNPELINEDDKNGMEKFKRALKNELQRSTGAESIDGIGNYL